MRIFVILYKKNYNIAHLFIWISHGAMATTKNIFHRIKTPFNGVTFYSHSFKPLYDELISKIKINSGSIEICELLNGGCPHFAIPDSKNSKNKYVYLPPMSFMTRDDDDQTMRGYIGMYHFQITNTGENTCNLISSEKLTDWDYLKK